MAEPQKSELDKFFDALDESFQATLEAVRGGTERGFRFSRRVVNEVEEAQRELTSLGRKYGRQPADLTGLYQSSVDLARRTVSNSANLSKEWLLGAQEAGRDAQATARKVIQANQAATRALGAAMQGAAREFGQGATRRARGGGDSSKPGPDAQG